MKQWIGKRLANYWQLMRADRPIGTLLLLWPALIALYIANQGQPSPSLLVIFLAGAFLVRSAGCIVNDIADRHFDRHVSRTQDRPLTSGRVSLLEAIALLIVLLVLALELLLKLNIVAVYVGFLAVVMTAIYPFTKRWTYLPQVWLALTFNLSIILAFVASETSFSLAWFILYAASACITVAYDTIYGMVDRDDDIKVGIKSLAILWGKKDWPLVNLLELCALLLLGLLGWWYDFNYWYYAGLGGAFLVQIYHACLTYTRQPALCFRAFLAHNWFLFFIFLGTYLNYLA